MNSLKLIGLDCSQPASPRPATATKQDAIKRVVAGAGGMGRRNVRIGREAMGSKVAQFEWLWLRDGDKVTHGELPAPLHSSQIWHRLARRP